MEITHKAALSQALSCWVVTDGKAGMENQCVGLAEALGLVPIVKRVRLRAPWKQLSPFLRHGLGYAFSPLGDLLSPPWPDLLIATGRASVPASLFVKRMSRKLGRATITVQLQNPVIDPSRFDLVVVPRHDTLSGANVMTTRGSLHRVTGSKLAEEAGVFLSEVATLPSPRIAVIIGGSNAVYSLGEAEMTNLGKSLSALVAQRGSLMITPSRRTGAQNMDTLKRSLGSARAYIWDGQGRNPYYGMLGLADFVIVTCDSVNLVSEACATGKPVFVVPLPGGSDKFRRFHQAMRDDGLTRAFEGTLETWSYPPLEDMALVAMRVGDLLRNR